MIVSHLVAGRGLVGNTSEVWRDIRGDYTFIRDLIAEADSTFTSPGLNRSDVRYLIVFAKYIVELEAMSFERQVAPSFPESFYSDLGDSAFELYTAPTFRALCQRLKARSMLDIGCGEGKHIDAALGMVPTSSAVGIERQPDVACSARNRLAVHPGVTVFSGDFEDFDSESQFDFILSSFTLFYLPEDRRLDFFRRVRSLLADGGTYVVCQYFPDFEDYQAVLVRTSMRFRGLRHYLSGVGNSLVRAEALLNRTLQDFRSVMYWHVFTRELSSAGLAVDEVIPADGMFYSYYVLVRVAPELVSTGATQHQTGIRKYQ